VIRALAAVLLLPLAGCAGLVAAGSATGALGGSLALFNQVIGSADSTIRTACSDYETGRAAAEAVLATGIVPASAAAKVKIIEEYGDAACANPPQGDALSTAIWLGQLIGQVATLTSVTAPATAPAAPSPSP
jgi:hypothetical protein